MMHVQRLMYIGAVSAIWIGLASCQKANQPRVLHEEARAQNLVAMSETVDEGTAEALRAALDDERKAESLYAAILDRFGNRRPFSMIIQAERRHAAAVESLMSLYGVAVPDNRWRDYEFDVPETFREAAVASAEAERENIAMYDRLLEEIEQEDIRTVFGQLRAASLDHHLPAFERWSQ